MYVPGTFRPVVGVGPTNVQREGRKYYARNTRESVWII